MQILKIYEIRIKPKSQFYISFPIISFCLAPSTNFAFPQQESNYKRSYYKIDKFFFLLYFPFATRKLIADPNNNFGIKIAGWKSIDKWDDQREERENQILDRW